jgi:hypothetical protein
VKPEHTGAHTAQRRAILVLFFSCVPGRWIGLGARGRSALIAVIATLAIGCDVNTALERLSEARQIASELALQFSKASDASNRAVMADTDEASVAFARESEQAAEAVQQEIDALRPILQGLNYSDELRMLDEFSRRFADYREVDRRILDLAVENTNLKAQRLAFGPAQEAADAFRDAVESVEPATAANAWQVRGLAAAAVTTVREIQVLQAPHIADADDAVMTRMEKRMATSETAARAALKTLSGLISASSRPRLAAAAAALDRFMELNAQVIALSRRNTNVRSLALSLDQKRPLIAACEQSLHTLRDSLGSRGFTGIRRRM